MQNKNYPRMIDQGEDIRNKVKAIKELLFSAYKSQGICLLNVTLNDII